MTSGFDIFVAMFTLVSFFMIIVAIIYWMITIIDAFKRRYKSKDEKIKWLLLVNFLGYIGVSLYEREFKGYFKRYSFKPTLKNIITTLVITFIFELMVFSILKKLFSVEFLFLPALIISFPIIITIYPIICALFQKPKKVW